MMLAEDLHSQMKEFLEMLEEVLWQDLDAILLQLQPFQPGQVVQGVRLNALDSVVIQKSEEE